MNQKLDLNSVPFAFWRADCVTWELDSQTLQSLWGGNRRIWGLNTRTQTTARTKSILDPWRICVSSDWWFPTVVWLKEKWSWSQNWIQMQRQMLRSSLVVGRFQNLHTVMLSLQCCVEDEMRNIWKHQVPCLLHYKCKHIHFLPT